MTLDEIYASLPHMECKQLCANRCTTGPIPMGKVEWRRIVEYLGHEPHGDPQTWTCPMLEGNHCTVHEVRPLICRLWGCTEGMRCPHGCKADRVLTKQEGKALLKQVYEIEGISYDLWGRESYEEAKRTMLLTIGERLQLIQLVPVPEKAHYAVFKAVGKLRETLGFNVDEFGEFNMRVVAACQEHKVDKEFPAATLDFGVCEACGAPLLARQYVWDRALDTGKDIVLDDKIKEMICDALKKVDERGDLTVAQISLYEKFVGTE